MSENLPVQITGTITKYGTEVKISKSGKQYVKMSIKETDKDTYLNVMIMESREQAFNIAELLKAGDHVTVSGFIKKGEYTDKDGNPKKSVTLFANFINASDIPF